MTLDELDRAFLNDYAIFGFMNHLIAAIALNNAGARCDDTAAEMRKLFNQVSDEEAESQAKEMNDALRVQKILVAKLMAEFIAAIEDFGALCWAIQTRRGKGIYTRFVQSSPGNAADFYDPILAYPNYSLEQLLNLPSPADVSGQVSQDLGVEIVNAYQAFLSDIQRFATMYRNTASFDIDANQSWGFHPSWNEDANILLGVPGDAHKVLTNPRGFLVQAFNKIKHRFLVIENLDSIMAPLAPDLEIPYLPIHTNPDFVDSMFNNIVTISKSTGELAVLLILLDNHGIEL